MTNPITIYDALVAKLGRAPTSAELKADVKRLLEEGLIERAAKGKLAHQRKRTEMSPTVCRVMKQFESGLMRRHYFERLEKPEKH